MIETIRPRSIKDIVELHTDAVMFGSAFVDRDGHRVSPLTVRVDSGVARDERGRIVYRPTPVTLHFDSRDNGTRFL